MPDQTFPILTSGKDDWDSFEEDYLTDPTVRSKSSGGRPLARTGVEPLLKVWRYTHRVLTTTEKVLLDDWQNRTVKIGGVPFTWQDPRPGGGGYTVRLGAPIVFRPTVHKVGYYDATIHLIEEPTY